jgi:hypothetical protein
MIQKAAAQLSKAIAIKPDYARAQLFAGQLVYNIGVDLLTRSKTAEGDNASALKSNALKKFEEAVPYFLAVERLLGNQPKLSAEDKGDLKEAFDLLITVYDQKGDKEKVKEYEAKFNALK